MCLMLMFKMFKLHSTNWAQTWKVNIETKITLFDCCLTSCHQIKKYLISNFSQLLPKPDKEWQKAKGFEKSMKAIVSRVLEESDIYCPLFWLKIFCCDHAWWRRRWSWGSSAWGAKGSLGGKPSQTSFKLLNESLLTICIKRKFL